MKRIPLLAAAACTLAFMPAAWADTIATITPDANRVALVNGKATIKFMVSGQGDDQTDCGMWIEYGDNGSPDTRIIGRQEGVLPREFAHNFVTPGQYTVTAKGQRVKQTFGCSGSATTSVTIVEERGGYRRAAAQSCPEGWQMREGSYKRDTGAFSCAPAYPQQRMDCGPGLRYFEENNLIGCTPRARGRDLR